MKRFSAPPVVQIITVLNVVVFIWWVTSDEAWLNFMMSNFTISGSGLMAGRYWTLLTSVFSHNMLLHLLINMFVLRSFGGVMEYALGSRRFLQLYLFAGAMGSLAHALVSIYLIGEPDMPAVGASGAIAGIILCFSFMFPKEKILLLGIIPMPALFGALLFIGIDLWGLWAQTGGGGLPIGHGAHLGGAFFGMFYYWRWIRPRWKFRSH